MAFAKERFVGKETENHRHSPHLGDLLATHYDTYHKADPIYDFGCGDGYYLNRIAGKFPATTRGRLLGIEGSPKLHEQLHNDILLDKDVADPTHPIYGPPGMVICLEVAEHVSSERLPDLLTNLINHCKNYLILSWAVPRQAGRRHISCRSQDEVLTMLTERGMKFCSYSQSWRDLAGEDLWWFKNSLYVFRKNEY